MKILLLNVRTSRDVGELINVIREMEKVKINILGMCKMRWNGSDKVTADKHTIFYSGRDFLEK